MLTLLSSILGFLSAGLPNVLDFFKEKQNNAHELAMMKLQGERDLEIAKVNASATQKVEEIKLDEILAKGYFDEKAALYANDAEIGKGASTWAINLRSTVRPIITYGMFGLFIFVEGYTCYYAWLHNVAFDSLATKIWDEDTRIIWSSILSFWFGSRAFTRK